MYDFVVVGLGPAGSRFARRAGADGYDVIGFEQGQIGTPLACSGHVSTDLWQFTGSNAEVELLQNKVYGARFHATGPTGNGQTPDELARTSGRELDDAETFYKQQPVSNVIDRVGLDEHLAARAREAGADLREQHTVTDVEEREDHVEVTVRGPEKTKTVTARMVAGCDGPRSRVRSELGLDEPTELLHGVLGFDETPDAADYVDVHLTPPGFFAWRIPRGDAGVEFGLGAPPKADVSERFERFCDTYGVTIDRRCSGAIPIGPPDSVTSHRGFLIGDAAAQTKPFTGGGILYGMTSADHAVEAIDPESPATLSQYEQAWRGDLEREMQLGQIIRRAYSLPKSIQAAGLRTLSGEIGVHMDRPTSLLSPGGIKTLLP